ncbi:DUF72 domain-containing protein [Longimicrobium sp.]|uniref:DUF72 domain-containing protein n=1 Tax=Longimicrobium sp. TaxID=2029185 RepID=UPI002BD50487|nr:DUF72 domain-containing protein [Longimicrobium sp.]HSU16770.1 DUF72 domain-containing protein [Longimicrobium sp.]
MARQKRGTGRTFVGISGWTYPGWRRVFYPEGLAHRRELEYASRKLDSIEINGSFYSLQRPTSYARWYDETPPGFVFAVKGSRFITHMLKLRNVETALPNFFASGVLRLREKLGPILWQFPERMPADFERFARFLEALPKTSGQAAEIAERHDGRLDGRAWTEAEAEIPLRHAFEIRHREFLGPDFVALLREHNAALVFADTAGRWPYAEDVTTDFAYVRLHGAEQLYASGYTDEQLDWWAARIREWRRGCQPADATCVADLALDTAAGRDVYVYFDNDAKVHAPFDAIRLKERLSG